MTLFQRSFFKSATATRWITRVVFLVVAAAICVLPFPKLAGILPTLSPLAAVCSSIALRRINLTLFAIGMPLAILAFFKGRWFCFHLCPLGTLADLAAIGQSPPKGRFLAGLAAGRFLLVFCVLAAVFGWPLALWLDAMSVFSGAMAGLTNWTVSIQHLLLALPAALVLVLSFIWPRAWCDRLCPLGAFFQAVGQVGYAGKRRLFTRRVKPGNGVKPAGFEMSQPSFFRLTRREIIGAAFGLAGGYAISRSFLGRQKNALIRPPGTGSEARLARLCTRCGRCFQACSRNVIHPDLGVGSLATFLTPHIVIGEDYCGEWCNDCCKVCPTGAITRMSLEEKRQALIGLAVVNKETCLAWNDAEDCMVCHEYCPFQAVELVPNNGVNCPEIDATCCRGCGACQSACPALPSPAIVVKALVKQGKARLPSEATEYNT